MWCGDCYTSNPDVKFHIDTTDYKQKAGDEGYKVEDVARLEKA